MNEQTLALYGDKPKTPLPGNTVFGDRKVLNCAILFRAGSERSIDNMLWYLNFELGYRSEEGSIDLKERREYLADIARGQRFLRVLKTRRKLK